MKLLSTLAAAAFALTLVFSSTAHAAWHNGVKLKKVAFDGLRHRVMLYVDGPLVNPAGCGTTGYYEIKARDDSYELGRLALAAHLAGRKVQLAVHQTECGVFDNPVVTFVAVGEE